MIWPARSVVLFKELKDEARRLGVQVHAFRNDDFDWKGLYLLDPEYGAGIAINSRLCLQEQVWVLAHELGHHHAGLNQLLFSPFDSSGRALHASASRGSPKRRNEELAADEWAVTRILSEAEWRSAENFSPVDLAAISGALGLPVEAGQAWERRRRSIPSFRTAACEIRAPGLASLEVATVGNGGHQTLLRRLVPTRRDGRIVISFADFSLARERAAVSRGGWRVRYAAVLAAIAPAIDRAGGVCSLFGIAQPEI